MWYKSIKEIYKIFNTGPDGINNIEAEKRLKEKGKNILPKGKKVTIFQIFFQQFKSPIILILLVASVFSIITKSYADVMFIIVVILINSTIATYQEWKSQKNSDKLENMIKIKAKIVRNGETKYIDSENIVIGDIILLESGDKVPADLRLIETYELGIDESIMTGESIPKSKNEEILEENTGLADRINIAYAGTIVVKGRGKGIVISTGQDTEFGKVANNVISSKEEKSPLVIRMEKFSKQISIWFVVFAGIMAIFLSLKGYETSEIFGTVIALTVSAIPEGLTIAMTIILSISANKMAKHNVIVKRLNAVESLGSCTRIATDKTGTLTVNEQTAKKIVLPNGEIAYITGTGYNDLGDIETSEDLKKENLSQFKEIAKLGMINNESSLKLKENKWIYHGDAIDIAFLALAYKMNISLSTKIVSVIPYESRQKYSSVLYKEDEYIATVKGGVEKVLEFCDTMEIEGKKEKLDFYKIMEQADELSDQGFRVIALAKGIKEIYTGEYKEKDIPKLTYMGMVAFVDPIREDVITAIDKCKKAGIGITMITGDYKLTADAIARRLGITNVYSRVSPMQKLEIVEKFKKDGEFIAVTGDGVNDTPALKAANIGIAMGSGTDSAKETGNMIITDDNFASIVKGVEEGRHAYNNIRKIIYLLLSTGFSEIILFVLSIIFNLPIPLVAIQLLWLNLISNGIQGDALAFEKDTEDVMNNKVKSRNEKIFNKLLISEILVSALTMSIIEFILYIVLIRTTNYSIGYIRSILLTLMVFIENVHILNCRSEKISIFKMPKETNKFLIFSIIATSIIQIIIVKTASIAKFFKLETISSDIIVKLLTLALPIMFVMEIFKKARKK